MKIYRIAQVQTIGPVYHGTVYRFKQENIRRDKVLFFSDDKTFAYDYASQKSFEAKMDADIVVYDKHDSSGYIKNEKEAIKAVFPVFSIYIFSCAFNFRPYCVISLTEIKVPIATVIHR